MLMDASFLCELSDPELDKLVRLASYVIISFNVIQMNLSLQWC